MPEGDAKKIQLMAAKFGQLPSRDNSGSPAFDQQAGIDPNDLPWMFQLIVPDETPMTLTNLIWPVEKSISRPNLLNQLKDLAASNLTAGRPVIAMLNYANPDFSHSVLITGISSSSAEPGALSFWVLDPMTGKESQATVRSVPVLTLSGGIQLFSGLTFEDDSVADRKGALTAIFN